MYGTILMSIKLNNFDTQCLNGPGHLFPSFCYATQRIFKPLRVYEPGFNTDKYSSLIEGIASHTSQNNQNVLLRTT